MARTLTQEASGLLDVTKEFRSKLQSTKKDISQNFTDEEIDDQLGDVDFMNDFAEQLFDTLNGLKVVCEHVIADCRARKARLTKALIWDKIGEEEQLDEQLTELASADAKLMAHFYELASGCNKWYSGASKKFAQDMEDMRSTVKMLGRHKHIIMNYSNAEFHKVKGAIFNIVNSLVDAQREIAGVESYFVKSTKYMTKRITNDAWKYQLKYSTRISKRCASEYDGIEAFSQKINRNSKIIARTMGDVYDSFVAGAKKDFNAWDCDAMYPKPQKVDLGAGKWLGAITKYAKQGF